MDESTTTPGTLYVVSTPIGNLEDVTLRALRILKEAHVIAAEDTRHTRKLLSHFDIHTPLVSFHEHSTDAERGRLLRRLADGQSVALVTDAGTPGVSDPGSLLIAGAVAGGIAVVPIPGASAALTALIGSGLPMDTFRFIGFPPRKSSDRQRLLERLFTAGETLIFYEAPHRLEKTLRELADAFGERPACAARELTKVHEEFLRGPMNELPQRIETPVCGEWTIVIAGFRGETLPEAVTVDWHDSLRARLDAGESSKDAARAVAQAHNLNRREVYAAALDIRIQEPGDRIRP